MMRSIVATGLSLALVGCAGVQRMPVAQPEPAPPPRDLIAELYAMVEADDAIVVEPLPDPEIEDLRAAASRSMALRELEEASAALAQALQIRPGRPDLLQLRAEVALGLNLLDDAELYAIASFENGPRMGPLCRRNWAAIQLAREVRGNVEEAETARAQAERCTPEPVLRM
jgi:tetratricopeptide (TPR) repeat protein